MTQETEKLIQIITRAICSAGIDEHALLTSLENQRLLQYEKASAKRHPELSEEERQFHGRIGIYIEGIIAHCKSS